MKILDTPLKDVFVIEPKIFEDDRGYFFEASNKRNEKGTVLEKYEWVQENQSQSAKGVLRGLHFQEGAYAQSKLVRVISGEVFDVAVDLRVNSDTYGQWHGLVISAANKRQYLIPRGFAHGFLVLSDEAVFQYKCDNYFAPEYDSGIRYDDPDLNIKWPKLDVPYQLSEKDQRLQRFTEAYKF